MKHFVLKSNNQKEVTVTFAELTCINTKYCKSETAIVLSISGNISIALPLYNNYLIYMKSSNAIGSGYFVDNITQLLTALESVLCHLGRIFPNLLDAPNILNTMFLSRCSSYSTSLFLLTYGMFVFCRT